MDEKTVTLIATVISMTRLFSCYKMMLMVIVTKLCLSWCKLVPLHSGPIRKLFFFFSKPPWTAEL